MSIVSEIIKIFKFRGIVAKALGKGERNAAYPQFSDHYFTGEYFLLNQPMNLAMLESKTTIFT